MGLDSRFQRGGQGRAYNKGDLETRAQKAVASAAWVFEVTVFWAKQQPVREQKAKPGQAGAERRRGGWTGVPDRSQGPRGGLGFLGVQRRPVQGFQAELFRETLCISPELRVTAGARGAVCGGWDRGGHGGGGEQWSVTF